MHSQTSYKVEATEFAQNNFQISQPTIYPHNHNLAVILVALFQPDKPQIILTKPLTVPKSLKDTHLFYRISHPFLGQNSTYQTLTQARHTQTGPKSSPNLAFEAAGGEGGWREYTFGVEKTRRRRDNGEMWYCCRSRFVFFCLRFTIWGVGVGRRRR